MKRAVLFSVLMVGISGCWGGVDEAEVERQFLTTYCEDKVNQLDEDVWVESLRETGGEEFDEGDARWAWRSGIGETTRQIEWTTCMVEMGFDCEPNVGRSEEFPIGLACTMVDPALVVMNPYLNVGEASE